MEQPALAFGRLGPPMSLADAVVFAAGGRTAGCRDDQCASSDASATGGPVSRGRLSMLVL